MGLLGPTNKQSHTKAKIINTDTDEEIEVMFNPDKYTLSTSGDTTGEGANLEFKNVTQGDFTVNLLFDTYENEDDKQKDVRTKTKKITDLIFPTVEGKEKKTPPVCLFSWGDEIIYEGIISKIDQEFIMFLHSGIPVRAKLNVTFKPFIKPVEDAKLKGKDNCRKLHRVVSGDRLDIIANKKLKDAALWRKIAKANNIYNPFAFPTNEDIGKMLIIPD